MCGISCRCLVSGLSYFYSCRAAYVGIYSVRLWKLCQQTPFCCRARQCCSTSLCIGTWKLWLHTFLNLMPRIQCDCISTVDILGDCFIGVIRVNLIIQSRLTDSAVISSVVNTMTAYTRSHRGLCRDTRDNFHSGYFGGDIGVSPVLSELTLTQAPSSVSTGSKPWYWSKRPQQLLWWCH